jgi:hypothetical protein
VEKANGRTARVTGIRPLHHADGRGLSSFHLVIGLLVGGCVASSALAMSHGARPASVHRTTIRLGTLALLSVASGLGGAIIVGPVFGALPGHFAALWGDRRAHHVHRGGRRYGASGAVRPTRRRAGDVGLRDAGQSQCGRGLAVPLLPPFWSAVGQVLPTGAATTLVRNHVYFHGAATAQAWWVLAAWAAGGLLSRTPRHCGGDARLVPSRSSNVVQVT